LNNGIPMYIAAPPG